MRWMKRGLWVAAWGCWVWLGVALDRKLPRCAGEVYCRLPFAAGEESLGFVEEIPGLVSQVKHANDGHTTLHLWDATRAILIRDVVCPVANASLINGGTGWVVALPHEADNQGRTAPLAFDLLRERWVNLPIDAKGHPTFHWREPWGLFFDWNKQGRPENILVVDLMTGKPLFRWKPMSDAPDLEPMQPFFIGENSVAVPTARKLRTGQGGAENRYRLEVWKVIGENRSPTFFEGVVGGHDPFSTRTGRVTWHDLGKMPPSVRVFDLAKGQMIFSQPPKDVQQGVSLTNGEWPGPQLSSDGRAVLGVMSARLWDVDSGRELWVPSQGESIINHDSLNDLIETRENWNIGEGVLIGQTYTVRDLRTGELMFRTLEPSLRGRGTINRHWHLRIDSDSNTIHRFPPSVNWPVLALCQAILALPLVLLWAVLRWRRKRRMRLAGAVP